MPAKKSKNSNRKGKNKGKSRQASNANVSRPTLILRDHLMITQNVSGVNIKQINLAPTLSAFLAASVQARFY
jgi:hypothetical protein